MLELSLRLSVHAPGSTPFHLDADLMEFPPEVPSPDLVILQLVSDCGRATCQVKQQPHHLDTLPLRNRAHQGEMKTGTQGGRRLQLGTDSGEDVKII